MKIPFLCLLGASALLVIGLLTGDYIHVKENIGYVNAERERQRSADKQDASQPHGAKPGANKITGNDASQGENASDETHVGGMKLADWFIIFLTAAIACFTGGLLREETDRSRKELRAYLGIGSGEIYRLPNEILRAVVGVKNFGQTPAHNVRIAITGEFRPPTQKKPFPDPDFIPHNQPLAPTMFWTVGHEFSDMTRTDFQEVVTDKKLVYIWGLVTYDDIYGKDHILRFRFRNVVKEIVETEAGIDIQKWYYYPEEHGNSST